MKCLSHFQKENNTIVNNLEPRETQILLESKACRPPMASYEGRSILSFLLQNAHSLNFQCYVKIYFIQCSLTPSHLGPSSQEFAILSIAFVILPTVSTIASPTLFPFVGRENPPIATPSHWTYVLLQDHPMFLVSFQLPGYELYLHQALGYLPKDLEIVHHHWQ